MAIDKDYYVINDVVLEIDTKFIHFNHILFGDKYIYCICDSYFDGPISGKFTDNQWFICAFSIYPQSTFAKKYSEVHFFTQNYKI